MVGGLVEKYKDGNLVDLGTVVAEVIEELEVVKDKLNEIKTDDGEDMRDER